MTNTPQSEKPSRQVSERTGSNRSIDPTVNFEIWAGAVRRQMLASLKRREGVRHTWE